MTLRTIIYHSIKGNISTFKGYYIATSFSVMVFFITAMLLKHPQIPLNSMDLKFQEGASGMNIVVFIFLSLFIIYSAYTYIRLRSKDYALLKILGMKNKQLNLLHVGESLFIYCSGIITGVLSALILAKLFFMFIAKLLDLEPIELYWPIEPMIYTLKYFGALYLVITALSYLSLKRMELKQILQLGRKVQRPLQLNKFIVGLSFLLLTIGYTLAYTTTEKTIVQFVIPVTLIVIIGTFFFYHQAGTYLLQLLKKRKGFYYKGVHMLWISDLSYRVKEFSLVLFLTTIIMTVGLVVLSSFYSIAYNDLQRGQTDAYPLAIVADSTTSTNYADTVAQILTANKVKFSRRTITVKMAEIESWENKKMLISESNFRQLSTPHQSNICFDESHECIQLIRKPVKIKVKELHQTDTIKINNDLLKIKDQIDSRLFRSLYEPNAFIISDSLYEQLDNRYQPLQINVFDHNEGLSGGKELYRLSEKIYNHKDKKNRYAYIKSDKATQYAFIYQRRFYLFLAISFSVLFFICAGAMLYFKFFNHLKQDGLKYGSFYKIGLSKREITRSSQIQMAVLFFIPNVLALLHTSFALKALKNISYDEFCLSIPVIKVYIIVLIIQIIFFFIFQKNYNKHLLKSLSKK